MTRAAVRLLLSLCVVVAGFGAGGMATAQEDPWHSVDRDGRVETHLYFVTLSTCPHCATAYPFVEDLDNRYDWLIVHHLQLDGGSQEVFDLAVSLAEGIGEELRGVPAFLYCETMTAGYHSDETTGAELERSLLACHARFQAQQADEEGTEQLSLPLLGTIDPENVSLPTFTVVIGLLDAFNPCAFFVLLFLLSLLVHARSRSRMALIGGSFVLVSGLVYFALMVAWLNVFLLVGALSVVTLIAGVVAVGIALINIKDFFWLNRGMRLSIPESAKPKLFGRMRALTSSSSLPLMLLGTVTLAFVANSYELLCTAGFPLVFTRVLTLNDLPTASYYLYLVVYNLVYVIPLLVIVAVFVSTLGSRKLSGRSGRLLKLVSGLMMLGLGLVLVIAPDLLQNLLVAPVILVLAVVITAVIGYLDRRLRPRGTYETSQPSPGVTTRT